MAIVDTSARRAARKPSARKPTVKVQPKRDTIELHSKVVARIRELARTGQHALAVEQCTQALLTVVGDKPLPIDAQMELLDLRSESYVALGKLDLAASEAQAMLQLATAAKSLPLKACALSRQALVQMRQGRLKAAVESAEGAVKLARQTKQKSVLALALLRLGEAQNRSSEFKPGIESALQAVDLFEADGDPSGAGRTYWVAAFAYQLLQRIKEARAACQKAIELCTRAGDRYGVGNALIILSQSEPDIAETIRLLHQAQEAFDATGYAERRVVVLSNLGNAYEGLGLYHHAIRLYREVTTLNRAMGANQHYTYNVGNLLSAEISLGALDAAREGLPEFANLVSGLGEPNMDAALERYEGDLALAMGDPATALRRYRSGAQLTHQAGIGIEPVFWALAGRVQLDQGDPASALKSTTKATELHRAQGFAKTDTMAAQEIWWRHSQALAANRKTKEAHQALERAYKLLLEPIANLRDEGLRRNYLNKVGVNREIIEAWLADRANRSLPRKRLLAHLAIESNVREPFQRLADTGLRLNALHTPREIQEFIVEEATEISGGERVLLVLDQDGQRSVSHSLVPKGESATDLIESIDAYLVATRQTGSVSLLHTPEKASELKQRSRIVAPLRLQSRLIGYLYADIDGVYGRFDETDRDMLGLLANQAAVALDNAQWSTGLERKVEERTAELTASNASLEQRNAELAIINSIQGGLASKLDFREIVDLVGDKLREVFGGIDLGITWYDDKANLLHYLYTYEHGKRLPVIVRPPNPGGMFETRTLKRQATVFKCLDDYKRAGNKVIPGTDQGLSMISVPIVGSDRVIGDMALENFERENAYGDADLRLLSTVAATMGVALENARLFDETQRLLKETEQRNAELAIINSIQQGLAAELNFQAIVDLVGDKLREVFKTPDLGIRWYDEKANLVHYLYEYEHGKRMHHPPRPPVPGGMGETMARTRQPLVLNTAADYKKVPGGTLPGSDPSKSLIAVPIISSDRFLGSMIIENYERENAFGDSDLRLLTTIAGSLGTALENARLFDETQRLFKAEQQRAAELAIINSVQEGLASKLEMQAIYDLVGNKVREIFKADVTGIGLYDSPTNTIQTAFLIDHGERFYLPPRQPVGFTAHVLQTRQHLIIHTLAELEKRMAELGSKNVGGATQDASFIYVPILHGDVARGVMNVGKQQEHAFSEPDVSLLMTLGNAMSVALENARLFDETQRLLKETEQRNAELAIINSIQQGLAAELHFQAIVDLVGDKLRQVFSAPDLVVTWYDEKAGLLHYLYAYEHGKRLTIGPQPPNPGGNFETTSRTRQPIVLNTAAEYLRTGQVAIPGTDQSKSMVSVPIVSGDRVRGMITIENYERENAYGESDVRLVTTIAASLGTALENARLFDETQRLFKAEQERAAELQIINSIQQGLASKLDLQAIVDLVGAKLCDILDTDDIGIRLYDPASDLIHYLYEMEHGERLTIPAAKPSALYRKLSSDRQAIFGSTAEITKKYGMKLVPGTEQSKAIAQVPIIAADAVIGGISVESFERDDYFNESNIRLLQTIAASMGVALENARLFDETQRLFKAEQQRAAELAVINSIQQGMASKLDFQAIVDLVGDKVREVFRTGDIGIRWYDAATGLMHYLYQFEHGVRQTVAPARPMTEGPWARISRTREPFVLKNLEEAAALGVKPVAGTDQSLCAVFVPILGSDRVLGLIVLENYEREDAFGEAEVRLLSTVAASMGVALENARLFDETQRLLKETEQRAAELAVINSIQHGMASKLEFQAIIDLVGDKLREVLRTGDIGIRWYDAKANLIHSLYEIEHGRRLTLAPRQPMHGGLWSKMVETRQPIALNTVAEQAAFGLTTIPGTDQALSMLSVPILGSDRALGIIVVEDHEREHAYGEAEMRLLSTVAASMGVALENARLFDETQRLLKETEQRNAELAIINSVQAALAAELNIQGIYDAVGDKIRQIFGNRDIGIRIYDPKTDLLHFPYTYENGVRLNLDSEPLGPTGFTVHVLRTRQALVVNENMAETVQQFGSSLVAGTQMEKSAIYVPLIAGEQARGAICMMDMDREHAFSESDVRLLQTLANSMSVALENARLFDETQRLLKETEQRNAELAIINSVQAALAAELNIQGIYDSVGDKIREIFGNRDVGIRIYDPKTNLIHYPYVYEGGKRIVIDSRPLSDKGFSHHVLRTRETLVINENMDAESEKYGSFTVPGTQDEKAAVFVPLVVGDQARGLINLLDLEKEHAFSESDVRLLQTLANSMSVALENARLFDETQRLLKETEQRNAELAIINSVQAALAAELNIQGIYDAVGDKIRAIFSKADVGIRIYEPETRRIHYPYTYENGKRLSIDSGLLSDRGFAAHVLRTRETVVVNENMEQAVEKYGSTLLPGTEMEKSLVMVPMVAGDQPRGIIRLMDMEHEHAFSDSDVRLLQTLANSMSVALENARLFDETERLLKMTEQRAAELTVINRIQEGMSAKLEFLAIIDLVGDKLREVFKTGDLSIRWYDPKDDVLHFLYQYEHGERTTR
jgi:GAF domain-containing protein